MTTSRAAAAGDEPTALHVQRRRAEVDDAPLVVLLHGITDAGPCWDPVIDRLDPRYDVVTPDLRGHGETPLPDDGPVTLEVLAADVARLLDDLAAPGPAILVGHSLGAATAATLAAVRPGLVRALVLVDPPWFAAPPEPGQDFDHASWVRELQALDHAGRVATGRASNPNWSDADIEPWAVSKEQVDVRFLERYESASMHQWRRTIADIDVPTLLITGDVDRGALVTPDAADEISRLGADLSRAHLAGTGHSIQRDRPDVFLEHLHGFLAEVAP